MRPTLDTLLARITSVNPWELARRFSGVAAIVVLGVTMVLLASRAASLGETRKVALPALPAPTANPASGSGTNLQSFKLLPRVEELPTLVFYLYYSQEQRRRLQDFEDQAGREAGEADIDLAYRYFALDASTPESEVLARDTVFQAALAGGPGVRIVVHDLRAFTGSLGP